MSNITCSNFTNTGMVNCTNGSTTSSPRMASIQPFDLYSSTAKIAAYSTLYGLVSIIGVTGNIMVFLVIAMNRSMHTATNVLLLNLSLSDLLFVAFSAPGLLAIEICNGRWPFNEGKGKMMQQTTILVATSSVFTMMVIAFERFLAVVYPLKQMARKKKTTVALAMVTIWICSIAVSIPMGIYTISETFIAPIERDGKIVIEEVIFLISTLTENEVKAYTVFIFITTNVIPIIVLSFFYICIVWKLWNPDQRLTLEVSTSSRNQKPKNFVEKTRRKTTIMLLTVVLVFFLFWFPYNMFNLLLIFGNSEDFNAEIVRHANSILRLLLLVNSASNPIIYNFLSEKFRTGFQSIFACRWRALKRVSAASTDAETVLS